ncbi:hypothetical protein AGMMS50212_00810 [Spirochaetia bacterium]|nr:hypothetical protein AGMMS50212_00810 [Spirochaetia bacterium]
MDAAAFGSLQIDNSRYSAETLRRLSSQADGKTANSSFAQLLENSLKVKDGAQDSAAGKKSPIKIDKTDKLYEQCEALETFLLKTLITGMRRTVDKSSELTKTGFAGEMYEDMLYDEYAKDFSRNANFGLAELAYLELTGQRGKLMLKNP